MDDLEEYERLLALRDQEIAELKAGIALIADELEKLADSWGGEDV